MGDKSRGGVTGAPGVVAPALRAPMPATEAPAAEGVIERRLRELHDAGVLTGAEFASEEEQRLRRLQRSGLTSARDAG